MLLKGGLTESLTAALGLEEKCEEGGGKVNKVEIAVTFGIGYIILF